MSEPFDGSDESSNWRSGDRLEGHNSLYPLGSLPGLSPLLSPLISDRPKLSSVISSPTHSLDRFRFSPRASKAPDTAVDEELIDSIHKLDQTLSQLLPENDQKSLPARSNASSCADTIRTAGFKPSQVSPRRPSSHLNPGATPSRPSSPGLCNRYSSMHPSDLSPKPSRRSCLQLDLPSPSHTVPLTESALRQHSMKRSNSDRSHLPHPAVQDKRPGSYPNEMTGTMNLLSPASTDLDTRLRRWATGQPKSEEVSNLLDFISKRESQRARELHQMLRVITEQAAAREKEFDDLIEIVRQREFDRQRSLTPRSIRVLPVTVPTPVNGSHRGITSSEGASRPSSSTAHREVGQMTHSRPASVFDEFIVPNVGAASPTNHIRAASKASSIRGSRNSQVSGPISRTHSAVPTIRSPSLPPGAELALVEPISRAGSVARGVGERSVAPSVKSRTVTSGAEENSTASTAKPESIVASAKTGSVAPTDRATSVVSGAEAGSVAPSGSAGSEAPEDAAGSQVAGDTAEPPAPDHTAVSQAPGDTADSGVVSDNPESVAAVDKAVSDSVESVAAVDKAESVETGTSEVLERSSADAGRIVQDHQDELVPNVKALLVAPLTATELRDKAESLLEHIKKTSVRLADSI